MKVIKIVLFNVLLLFLLLLIGELSVRLFFPNRTNYIRTYPREYKNRFFNLSTLNVNWPKIDSNFGWVCNNTKKIKFSNPRYNVLNMNYTISQLGFRKCLRNDLAEIMFLGDSFVFGVYLPDSNSIPSLLSSKLQNVSVANFGIPGWGIDQMYLSYLMFGQNHKKFRTVVLMFIDDDISRVLEAYRFTEGMNKPSFELVNDSLTLRKPKGKNVIVKTFERSKLLNPFYQKYNSNLSIQIVKKIFIELNEKTKENNQRFLVVHCPVIEQIEYPEKFSSTIGKDFFIQNKIDFIELAEKFKEIDNEKIDQYYLKNDGHLSEKGTKFVANILSEKIKTVL